MLIYFSSEQQIQFNRYNRSIITINLNQIYSKELHTLLRGVFNMFVFVICLWNEHKRMFINL